MPSTKMLLVGWVDLGLVIGPISKVVERKAVTLLVKVIVIYWPETVQVIAALRRNVY